MTATADVKDQIRRFLEDVTRAMGVPLAAEFTESEDGYRVDLTGEGGEALLWQRGEALKALQHIVSTAFRRQLGDDRRVVVDCQHFRRDKDLELRQMARFLAEKARQTGHPQEIGPLNAYERRIVHLAISEFPGASSESVGDAAVKTVIITAT
jgi:spoIIIJ-associated protein